MLVFLDIETTGLQPLTHGVLEIYAKAYPNEHSWADIPDFNALFLPENYVWDAYCLKLHSENGLLRSCLENGTAPREAIRTFRRWLSALFARENQKVTLAGKDVGRFDLPFLTHTCGDLSKLCHHNTLDIGSLLWQPTGSMKVLSLDELSSAAGMPKQRHRAKDDVELCVALFERCLAARAKEAKRTIRAERDAFEAKVAATLEA